MDRSPLLSLRPKQKDAQVPETEGLTQQLLAENNLSHLLIGGFKRWNVTASQRGWGAPMWAPGQG